MQNHSASLFKKIALGGVIVAVVAISFAFLLPQVYANRLISPEQRRVYDKNIGYFDVEECTDSTSNIQLSGNDNAAKIFNFFVSNGFGTIEAAAITANILHESGGGNPMSVQPSSTAANADELFAAGDVLNKGVGLMQWTKTSNKEPNKFKLIYETYGQGGDVTQLETQLLMAYGYIVNHGNYERFVNKQDHPNGKYASHKPSSDVGVSTWSFMANIEIPAGDGAISSRAQKAEDILANIGGTATTAHPPKGSTASSAQSSSSTPTKEGIYILGDSITEAATSKYESGLKDKFNTVVVNGLSSRKISGGPSPDGLAALDADKDKYKNFGTIVVALGTNGGTDKASIKKVIDKINSSGFNGNIYWVDTAVYNKPDYVNLIQNANKAIYENKSMGYEVISWAKTIDPSVDPENGMAKLTDKNGYINTSDGLGIYPTTKGVDALVKTVADGASVTLKDSSKNSCGCVDGLPNEASGSFTKYNLTDDQLKQIASLAQQEQGTPKGAAAEASLMANLFELRGSKYGTGADGLYNYVRTSGWFANAATHMDAKKASNEVEAAVKSVLVDGKRTLPGYIDEHDYLGDIASVSNDGATFDKNDRSKYQQYKTQIHQGSSVGGGKWIFYSFPDVNSDPFGYTSEDIRKQKGEFHYDFDGGVAGGGDVLCNPSSSGDTNALQQTVLKYAWPDYASGKTEAMPAYKQDYDGPKDNCGGIDCGRWVSFAIRKSGWDPKYPLSKTSSQEDYMKSSDLWEEVKDVSPCVASSCDYSKFQPGDVAVNPTHTFLYVGDIPGFNSKIASASSCDRAPMAGKEDSYDKKEYRIYRKVK